jgi:lactoylglutathione lyase
MPNEEHAKTGIFTHTSIRVSSMERSIDFYTRLLGLKLLSRREIPQNNAEIAFLQDPDGKGARLELTYFRNQKKFIQAEYEDRLFDHLAFEIKEMQQTISKLRKEKITITDEPFTLGPSGPLIAFIEDPDYVPADNATAGGVGGIHPQRFIQVAIRAFDFAGGNLPEPGHIIMVGMDPPAGMVGDDQQGILPGPGAADPFVVAGAFFNPVRDGRSFHILIRPRVQGFRLF